MGLVKYEMLNYTPDDLRAVGNKVIVKVSHKESLKLEKQGYTLVRKHYFLLSPFSSWWSRLSDSNKITIIIAIGTTIVGVIIAFK